ncbi:uncharacterized protein LOC126284789 [Schistocerca gregaria]|uniref:uncharacterized protein LOC126284789 n=1 Tax=Schistocerca gregaria TaxID=7010 RepID=UPI00211ED9F2|nr:uncharacterized protein LOC126284789 [Schistocerca gregaria]
MAYCYQDRHLSIYNAAELGVWNKPGPSDPINMLKQTLVLLAVLAAATAAEEAATVAAKPVVPEEKPDVILEKAILARGVGLKPEVAEVLGQAGVEDLQQDEEKPQPVSVPIIRSLHDVGDTDKWQESFRYEMPDGTLREESLQLRSVGDDKVPVVRGRSVWVAGDGRRIEVLYEADENGFRAYGDHLPRVAGQEALPAPDSRRQPVSVVVTSVPAPPPPPPPSPTPTPFHRPTPRPTTFRPLPSPTPRPAPIPVSRGPSKKPIRHRWA